MPPVSPSESTPDGSPSGFSPALLQPRTNDKRLRNRNFSFMFAPLRKKVTRSPFAPSELAPEEPNAQQRIHVARVVQRNSHAARDTLRQREKSKQHRIICKCSVSRATPLVTRMRASFADTQTRGCNKLHLDLLGISFPRFSCSATCGDASLASALAGDRAFPSSQRFSEPSRAA